MKKLFLVLLFVPLVSFGQELFKAVLAQKARDNMIMGVEKMKVKDYEGAIADYTKAIEINPDFGTAYNNRGISKRKLNDYYGSIADFTKAIEINPDFAIAYSDRGFSKYSLKDYYGAIADYTKFTELDPDNPVAFFLRGDAKDKIDDFKGRLIQLIQRKLQTGMDYFLPKFQM